MSGVNQLRKFQIKDGEITRAKLQPDFLEGSNLDLTGGNADATLTGLAPAVNPSDVVIKSQLDALSSNLAGGVQLRDDLAGNADLTGNATGNPYADAGNGYIKGDKFVITSDGNITVSDGTIEVKAGDAIIFRNDVASDAAVTLADIYKVDNTESADIVRSSQVVDNLTSTSSTDVLSALQGKTLKDLIDAINAVQEVRGEAHDIVNAADTVTLANTPIAGTLIVFRNSARTVDFTLAGNVVTLTNPASEAGECVIVDYKHL